MRLITHFQEKARWLSLEIALNWAKAKEQEGRLGEKRKLIVFDPIRKNEILFNQFNSNLVKKKSRRK